MTLMTSKKFVEKAIEISKMPTQYLMGGYGCRLCKDWYDKNYKWNKANAKKLEEKYNTVPITFGFDCICLIKGILWGFEGVANEPYGGAVYNRETDYTVERMMETCKDLSTDFDTIQTGELVFLGKSHAGIYIGDGEVIESTPAWKCCVQRTLLPSRNSTNYEKLPVRRWDTHGHSSLIDYDTMDYRELEKAYKDLSEQYNLVEQQLFRLNGKIEKIRSVIIGED